MHGLKTTSRKRINSALNINICSTLEFEINHLDEASEISVKDEEFIKKLFLIFIRSNYKELIENFVEYCCGFMSDKRSLYCTRIGEIGWLSPILVQ